MRVGVQVTPVPQPFYHSQHGRSRRIDGHTDELNGLSKRTVNQPCLEHVRTGCSAGVIAGAVAIRRSNVAGQIVRREFKGRSTAAAVQQTIAAGGRTGFIHDQDRFIPIRIVAGLGQLAGDRGVGYEYRDGRLRNRRIYRGRNPARAGDKYVTGQRGILLRPNQRVVR